MKAKKLIANAKKLAFLSPTAAVLLATVCMFPVDLSAAILNKFSNGRAVVCFNETHKCVVIDKQGNVVVTPESLSPRGEVYIGEFRNELAQVRIGPYLNAKVGFIDINGNWVIKPVLADAGYFSETDNLVGAQEERDGKSGFIDKNGNWVIPPRYYEVTPFRHGYAMVRTSELDGATGQWGIIDLKGDWAISPTNKSEKILTRNYSDKGVWVIDGIKRWALMGFFTGKPLSRTYNYAFDFNENSQFDTGVSILCDGKTDTGLYACYEVDAQGHEKNVSPPSPLRVNYQYEEFVAAGESHDDVYEMNGRFHWGLATKDGSWILTPSSAYKSGMYAGEGKWIIEINKEKCNTVKNGDCYYYVNSKGKADPDVELASASRFSEGLADVRQADGSEGYINKEGVWGISSNTLKKNLARWYKAEDDADAMGKRVMQKSQQENRRKEEKHLAKFKKSLKEGDETNCGMVIEAKPAMVNVNFPVKNYGNEHWIKRSQIFPPGYECHFVNGAYQMPAMKDN